MCCVLPDFLLPILVCFIFSFYFNFSIVEWTNLYNCRRTKSKCEILCIWCWIDGVTISVFVWCCVGSEAKKLKKKKIVCVDFLRVLTVRVSNCTCFCLLHSGSFAAVHVSLCHCFVYFVSLARALFLSLSVRISKGIGEKQRKEAVQIHNRIFTHSIWISPIYAQTVLLLSDVGLQWKSTREKKKTVAKELNQPKTLDFGICWTSVWCVQFSCCCWECLC